jgi:UDP-GlcNAc:undecaprenyl-phosphate GlcNAc-1-phosphate transferase
MTGTLNDGAVVATFVVALLVSAAATPIVSRFARMLGIVDRPGDRTVNEREGIPLLGGIAVALGCFVGLAVAILASDDGDQFGGHLEALIIGGVVILGTGVYDDRFAIRARTKLAMQLIAAGIAIAFGFQIGHFTDPITQTHWILPTWIMVILTTLWIVGITNALNLIDGLDGLCTGVGAIIGVTLTIVCWQGGNWMGVFMGAAMVGGMLGFLPFNFSPARIFLGDTGALFIGYGLSLLALEGYRQLSLLTFLVPLLALAVPLLDTLLSIFRRVRRRSHIFDPDREHMHHRLLHFQGTQRDAVLSIYFLTTCFCVIALSFTSLRGYIAILVVVVVIALTVRLLRNLGFFDLDGVEVPPSDESAGAGGH